MIMFWIGFALMMAVLYVHARRGLVRARKIIRAQRRRLDTLRLELKFKQRR